MNMNRTLTPFPSFLVTLVLMGAMALSLHAEEPEPAAVHAISDADTVWFENWEDAVWVARNEKRPMLVDIYSDYCGPCRAMHEQVFPTPEIRERLSRGWVCVRVNSSDNDRTVVHDGKAMTYRKLAAYFRARAIPTYIFFDRKGEPVQRAVGAYKKEKFALILDYMFDEEYKRGVTFADYTAENSSEDPGSPQQ